MRRGRCLRTLSVLEGEASNVSDNDGYYGDNDEVLERASFIVRGVTDDALEKGDNEHTSMSI